MKVKYIVAPFRLAKGKFTQAELRPASSEEGAIRMAEAMAGRFAGVAAFEVYVDEETGELHSPRLLAVHGTTPDLEVAVAA